MSTTIDHKNDYLNNPYFKGHLVSDFSPFYITIAICTIIIVSLLILNFVCCLCSDYRSYWRNRHTGNRWIAPIWTTTVHKQPPLDLTELHYVPESPIRHYSQFEGEATAPLYTQQPVQYQQHKSPSPPPLPSAPQISPYPTQQRPQRPPSSRALLEKHRHQEEYVELQKRESEI